MYWSQRSDSNRQPTVYKTVALPLRHIGRRVNFLTRLVYHIIYGLSNLQISSYIVRAKHSGRDIELISKFHKQIGNYPIKTLGIDVRMFINRFIFATRKHYVHRSSLGSFAVNFYVEIHSPYLVHKKIISGNTPLQNMLIALGFGFFNQNSQHLLKPFE